MDDFLLFFSYDFASRKPLLLGVPRDTLNRRSTVVAIYNNCSIVIDEDRLKCWEGFKLGFPSLPMINNKAKRCKENAEEGEVPDSLAQNGNAQWPYKR